ncbi:MAG TPA: hypothetical protein VII06_09015 [Chloroflexota bacterium]
MLHERHETTDASIVAPPEAVRAPIPPQGPPARPEIEQAFKRSWAKFEKAYRYLGRH